MSRSQSREYVSPNEENDTTEIDDDCRREVLELCKEDRALPFQEAFPAKNYRDLQRYASGSYSQVFRGYRKSDNKDIVLKLIRLISVKKESRIEREDENTDAENYMEALSEIAIDIALSSLHNKDKDQQTNPQNVCHTFPKLYDSKMVYGQIPPYFYKASKTGGRSKRQPSSKVPTTEREYVVLEMKYCGKSLWRHMGGTFNIEQLFSCLKQMILGLAAAEAAFEFEHRDLHPSNVVVCETKKKALTYVINEKEYHIDTYGYKTTIIDTTFARLRYRDRNYYKDLTSTLSHLNKKSSQDRTYQDMVTEVGSDWKKWRPRTNLFWLRYTCEMMSDCKVIKNCSDTDKKKEAKNHLKKIIQTLKQHHKIVHILDEILE